MMRHEVRIECDTPGCMRSISGEASITGKLAVLSAKVNALNSGWKDGKEWKCPVCVAKNNEEKP